MARKDKLEADAVTDVEQTLDVPDDNSAAAETDTPGPPQTDNRPRVEDGDQLPEDVALGRAPLPDEA